MPAKLLITEVSIKAGLGTSIKASPVSCTFWAPAAPCSNRSSAGEEYVITATILGIWVWVSRLVNQGAG